MSLYLVDGHALAYRSYYAFIRRPLVNSKGEETSAVFGFLKTMMNLLEKYDPTHLAVVFDSAELTFRSELFAEYKANRPKMPESLAAQLPIIFELLEAMSIPCLSVPGYEADDILATMSSRLENDVPVKIVSGDKDLFQIVSDRTHVIRPGKNGLLGDEFGPKRLEEETGLRAEQFVDYQALMGDSTDNVPGVSGIGEKTALKLVQEFGGLDTIYEKLDTVTSKSVQSKLQKGRDAAILSRKLTQLERSVPVDTDMEKLVRKPFDRPKLAGILKELEFYQQFEALGISAQEDAPPAAPVTYRLVDTEEALAALVGELERSDEFAVDVETSDRNAMRAVLAGISISTTPTEAWYIPVASVLDEEAPSLLLPRQEAPGLALETVRKHLGAVLSDPSIRKVGQNAKYDAIVLENAGLPLAPITFDTMLASYCLHPGRRSHGLDSLSDEFFGHKNIPFASLFDKRSKKKDIRTVPLSKVTDYACEDADYTLRLKQHFAELLDPSQVKHLFTSVEMPLSRVLMKMEMDGVALDVPFLKTLASDLATRLERIQARIYQEVGEEFNINSTARLQDVLFNKLGLKPKNKTKTGFSTDIDVLKTLTDQHAVPQSIIDYRTLAKLQNTYVEALPKLVHPKTNRVHTSYNQAVATTGRLSSSDPNLQNIPIRTPLGREIRKAFISPGDEWVLLDADYSQIELRIMAHLSQDAELLKAFADDDDVHRRTAARILGVDASEVSDEMRSRAKTVNFGIMYGMGARGLAQSLDMDVKTAKQFIDDYFASYPGIKRFIDETIAEARKELAVSTLLGRIRQIPEMTSGDRRTQAFAHRIAVNTPIQGTAADIIKIAMVSIDRALTERGLRAKMILQVHDELLFEVPKAELDIVRELVRSEMEGAIAIDVPLKVDMGVGQNWLEAHG